MSFTPSANHSYPAPVPGRPCWLCGVPLRGFSLYIGESKKLLLTPKSQKGFAIEGMASIPRFALRTGENVAGICMIVSRMPSTNSAVTLLGDGGSAIFDPAYIGYPTRNPVGMSM